MGGITYTVKGDYKKTHSFLEKALEIVNLGVLDKYGRMGVEALSANTPIDSGETASSWYYNISRAKDEVTIEWRNSHMDDDGCTPVAILIQYGHGTRNGGYVQGIDFVNSAMRPIFEKIADDILNELCG